MSRNPSAIYRRRRSADRRACEHCGAAIQKGQLYYTASLPPHADVNSSERWWTLRICEECGRSPASPASQEGGK